VTLDIISVTANRYQELTLDVPASIGVREIGEFSSVNQLMKTQGGSFISIRPHVFSIYSQFTVFESEASS